MILLYAPGSGLGHLTRVRAVVHTLAIEGPLAVVTDSPFASSVLPEAAVFDTRCGIQPLLDELRPDAVYVDAFPVGIEGELSGVRFAQPVFHLARILQWQAYRSVASGPLPPFDRTWFLEEVDDEHGDALKRSSQDMRHLELRDAPVSSATVSPFADDIRPLWLIVHSGPQEECQELAAYARAMAQAEGVDPRFVLVTPTPVAETAALEVLRRYPAVDLFPLAARIVTACGFNVMRQTAPYAARHRFLPFRRRFDNQFLRAARRRAIQETGVGAMKLPLTEGGPALTLNP